MRNMNLGGALLVVSGMILQLFISNFLQAQERIEKIPFGDMQQWMTRKVDESFVIGGEIKEIYEITPHKEHPINTAYNPSVSNWGNSSVYAYVNGVHKASTTVFPEYRSSSDICARLETRMETVKVLGIINISVLATGTIYLGKTLEPVKDSKNPMQKLSMGIPYTKRPSALQFDYKVDPAGARIYAPGFKKQQAVAGQNAAEAVIILQHRWEDADGNIHALRVGTGWHRFDKVVNNWQIDYRIKIEYGDITKDTNFKSYQGLLQGESAIHSLNSKGENCIVNEEGWASADKTPTHIMIRFSSGYGGAYVGSIGSKFWVDNVELVFVD